MYPGASDSALQPVNAHWVTRSRFRSASVLDCSGCFAKYPLAVRLRAAFRDELRGELLMSQTITSSLLTTFWNMSAPLHPLLIENSARMPRKIFLSCNAPDFKCKPQIIATRGGVSGPPRPLSIRRRACDYRLPGWTGMDAFLAMRQRGTRCPIHLGYGNSRRRRWRWSASSRASRTMC